MPSPSTLAWGLKLKMTILRMCAVMALALMFLLTLYTTLVLNPQIRELKRKMDLPEFQGTAHQQTIVFTFKRLDQRSVRLRAVLLALGLVSLGLVPSFLR